MYNMKEGGSDSCNWTKFSPNSAAPLRSTELFSIFWLIALASPGCIFIVLVCCHCSHSVVVPEKLEETKNRAKRRVNIGPTFNKGLET